MNLCQRSPLSLVCEVSRMNVRLSTVSIQRPGLTLSSQCLNFTVNTLILLCLLHVIPASTAGVIDVYLLLKHLFSLPAFCNIVESQIKL